MADLPTSSELAEIGRAAFRAALDPGGTGAVNLRPGSRNDVAISALTGIGNRLGAYVADRVSAARRSSATGEDLDAHARDLYGETRKSASASTGKVRLTRPGTTATAIPKGSRFAVPAEGSTPAVIFEASEDVSSSATTAVVPVRCTETGPRGNITGPQAVAAILDPLPDTTWTLDATYTTAGDPTATFGGGAADETDDELRQRLDQISIDDPRERATRSAVLAGALRVPGVRYATIVEPLDGTGIVYAGDAAFALTDAMRKAIDTELLDWRALGVPALIRGYNAQTVTVTGTIYMARALANYDLAAIKAAATSAVKRYFDTGRPSPDEYFVNAIEAALFSAHDEIQNVALASPLANALRPADTGYGAITALNRYRVTDASISIAIAAPQTT
jgi:uncharacterized phage protein gp47/JayE